MLHSMKDREYFFVIFHNCIPLALFNELYWPSFDLPPFQGEDSRDKQDEKENIKKKEVMITFHDVGMNRKWDYFWMNAY